MINLDLELRLNGKRVVMSEKLGSMISNYLLEQIGLLEETSILDKVKPVKFPSAKVYGQEKKKYARLEWHDDEILRFIERVEEIRRTGMSFNKIGKTLSPEFQGRTTQALYLKIVDLKKKGMIKII